MPTVLKKSFSKSGIGTLSLVHPFSGAERSGSWLKYPLLPQQAERIKICILTRWNSDRD